MIRAVYTLAFVLVKFEAVALLKVISLMSNPVTSSLNVNVVVNALLVGLATVLVNVTVGLVISYSILN